MTVKELKEALHGVDDNIEVIVHSDYDEMCDNFKIDEVWYDDEENIVEIYI